MTQVKIPKQIVHILINETESQLYVVPVFSAKGFSIEIVPITKFNLTGFGKQDAELLADVIAEKAKVSAACCNGPMPERWDGEHEEAWLSAMVQVDIAWYDDGILIEECFPVHDNLWHLPALDVVSEFTIPSNSEWIDVAHFLLDIIIFPRLKSDQA